LSTITEIVTTLWQGSRRTRRTLNGWISGNAVCCHNRGEKPDTRGRGGLMVVNENFNYHCFNCGFKAGWSTGKTLSKNTKLLLEWLGLDSLEISRLALTALKFKEESQTVFKDLNFDLQEKQFPDQTLSVREWLDQGCTETELLNCVNYLNSRGFSVNDYDWHWSCEPGYRDRVIVPFYNDGVLVGWTGRKTVPGSPKYLSDSQSGYLFNIDNQTYDRKYLIVVEGPFDAIAVDGVAIQTNRPNATQTARIKQTGKSVIVVPDRDRAGAKLVDAALENDWAVSLPPWEEAVKDVGDAFARYGRLYTLFTILHYNTSNEIKKTLIRKKLENLR
jgi:hypothetical protein